MRDSERLEARSLQPQNHSAQGGGEPAKRLPPAADEAGSVTSAKGLPGAGAPVLATLPLLSS